MREMKQAICSTGKTPVASGGIHFMLRDMKLKSMSLIHISL